MIFSGLLCIWFFCASEMVHAHSKAPTNKPQDFVVIEHSFDGENVGHVHDIGSF